ncbi:MAG: hypothetical protein R3A11_07645 [Bdellovibrionota bacterium]
MLKIRHSVQNRLAISITPDEIRYMRKTFHNSIADGEKKLHDFSKSIIKHYWGGQEVSLRMIIWGRCRDYAHNQIEKTYHDLFPEELEESRRFDSRITRKYTPVCGQCDQTTNVIASFYHYQLKNLGNHALDSFFTRIKTTQNICYKVADMVFDLDQMFTRDKIFNDYSQILTDVYGIKMTFRTKKQLHGAVEYIKSNSTYKIVEEKNYLGKSKKKNGFEVYKIVLQQDRQIFEIQLQTQKMFAFEKENANASHKTYKEKQMEQRRRLGREYANLYRALGHMFTHERSPTIEHIELGMTQKGMDDEF